MLPLSLSRVWRHIRGIYGAGRYEVVAKHWWSRQDRKTARLAARLLEHQAPAIDAEVRRRITDSMLYGWPLVSVPQNQWPERYQHLRDAGDCPQCGGELHLVDDSAYGEGQRLVCEELNCDYEQRQPR